MTTPVTTLMQGRARPWRIPAALTAADHDAYARVAIAHPIVAQALANRQVVPLAVATYLDPPDVLLGNPAALPDLDRAVERIHAAIARREIIGLYGDFDVDGLTATALLAEGLSDLGATVLFVIPTRADNHGVHPRLVDRLARAGARLMITVDTGSSSGEGVRYAVACGLDVIVTDHHAFETEDAPPAFAFINHQRADSTYGSTSLSGAGIAYKLLSALTDHRSDARAFRRRAIDLCGLGTIADVMPLVGENRLLVRAALRCMSARERTGLRAVLSLAGVHGAPLACDMSFRVAPRFNAIGRLGNPEDAVRLLLMRDFSDAQDAAADAETLNTQRKQEVDAIMAVVTPELDLHASAHILAGETWKPGIVGLAASRLVDRTGAPVCVLTRGADGLLRGSGRAPRGFDLRAALSERSDLLTRFGGHAGAAGLTIDERNVPDLREHLATQARALLPSPGPLPLQVDCVIPGSELTPSSVRDLHQELAILEPCGERNPPPILVWQDVELAAKVGSDRTGMHARLTIATADGPVKAIAFGQADSLRDLPRGTRLTIAGSTQLSLFTGRPTGEIVVDDVMLAS